MKLPTLYKIDSKGKLREWNIFFEENKFWTEQGINGMKMNVATPTVCESKNVGRSNETTAEEQAEAEATAKWNKKLKDGYVDDPLSASTKKFYEPMLAQDFKKLKDVLHFPVYSQPKLDGIRCLVQKEKGEIVARTRNGRIIESIPHGLKSLEGFFRAAPDSILDGELYNHDYKDDFNAIVSLVRKQKPVRSANDTDKSFIKKEEAWEEALEKSEKEVQYWVYDSPRIEFLKEENFFSMRNAHLQGHLSNIHSSCIQLVPTSEIHGHQALDLCYEDYVQNGYEGQMVRVDEGYQQKRSKYLLKRKEFQDAEYKVLDIDEGNGNRKGTAKHLICICSKTNKIFNSNIKGNFEYLKEILDNKEEYIGKYATIKFFQLTPDGIPRFPYAMSFRDYE